MQHIGIWYILTVFFSLESCLENINLSLSKSAIIEKKHHPKSSTAKLEKNFFVDLSPQATEIEIKANDFNDSQIFISVYSNKENVDFWTDNQSNEEISEKGIVARNEDYKPTIDQIKSNSIGANNFWINQDIAKEKKASKLVREKKLQERVFKVKEKGYLVRFYLNNNPWKAKIKDIDGKKFDLPAHLSEKDIELLASFISATIGMIQIVLPTFFKSGYVYLGGLKGGSKTNKEAEEDKEKQKATINVNEEIIGSLPEI